VLTRLSDQHDPFLKISRIVMKKIIVIIFIALTNLVFAQHTFSVPIIFANSSLTDTLRAGVGRYNTFGVDDADSLGIFKDKLAPPLPPTPIFDVRFVTIPGHTTTYPQGLGTGTYSDFRGYTGDAQIDTFLVKLTGDYVDNNSTLISWPSGLDKLATTWTMQPRTGSSFGPVNMVTATSVTLPASVYQIYIIKTGAIGTAVSAKEEPAKKEFRLNQNYPNPFNPSTNITFSLPVGSKTSLKVFNILGQEVAVLVDDYLGSGLHQYQFNAASLSSGVYIYRLQANGSTSVKRMILTK
jgi:hypothetical protein